MIRLRKYVNLHIEIDKEEGDICERRDDQENDTKEVIMISHLEIFFFGYFLLIRI